MTLPSHQQYKDSGTQWLGKVPSHWETQRVKWLFEIKKRIVGECGFDVLSITQQGIKIKDIESNDGQLSMDYSKYQLVEVGDFAMNHMDLLTGYVDISISEGVTSPDYRVFTVKNENTTDSKYFLYLFQNGYKRKIFYAFGQGASLFGRWRLPTEQFNDFLMPLPSVSEQKSIVKYLDKETAKIDALIAEQNKLVELLKEKRHGIISHAVNKGLNPKAKMKDSGVDWLGEVPEEWEVIALKKIISMKSGETITSENIDEIGMYPVYGGNGFRGFTNQFTHDGFFALIGRQGALCGNVNYGNGKFWASEHAVVAYPIKQINTFWLGEMLRIMNLNQYSVSAAQPGISVELVGNIRTILPPITDQNKIASHLENETAKIDNLISEASKASELLKERRSALISAAVTGKIDVRNSI